MLRGWYVSGRLAFEKQELSGNRPVKLHSETKHAAKFAEARQRRSCNQTHREEPADACRHENGSNRCRFDLAKRAKALNLDAIHDTVHEMARDEARHGKAFEGLLKRYFNK